MFWSSWCSAAPAGSTAGSIGAIIFMVARDQFSGIAPQYWYFWIGLLLVAVVMLLPNGVLGGLAQLDRALAGQAA